MLLQGGSECSRGPTPDTPQLGMQRATPGDQRQQHSGAVTLSVQGVPLPAATQAPDHSPNSATKFREEPPEGG